MAIAPPELTIKLVVDNREQELKRVERDALASARRIEQTQTAELAKGEAQRENLRKSAAVKQEIENAKSLQKQRLRWEKFHDSIAMSEERARLRMIKGQESWSARMTKSLDSVAFAVKGMAVAWATAQVTQMARGSIELAGGMREMAAGVNLSTQEFFAITSAMRDAGVQAEKIDPIFTRLNDLVSGGATPTQQTILDRLGINATGMTNVQLMDTLLGKINDRMISQSELGELVGNRVVPAWNRLANEINNVNDANSRYKFPIKDEDVELLDKMSTGWEKFWTQTSISIAGLAVDFSDFATNLGMAMRGVQGFDAAAARALRSQREAGMFTLPEQTVTAARPAGATSAGRPIPSPVDAQGRRLRRAGISPADRSFDLPQISRDLPVVTRATEEWNQRLSDTLTLAGEIEFRIGKFASSNTWQVAQAGAQAFNSILSMQAQLVQNELDGLNMVMQRERERWQIRSEAMREAGQEGSAAYRNELREFERLDRQRQKKANELQAKAFETNKRAQIAGTTMNTAQAVMNALATVKPFVPLGLIMAALATAQGGIQIATIAGQQNPYKGYAYGGFVPGQSIGDDTMIRVQGGEFVTNRDATRNNRAALEYANRGGIVKPEGMGGGITVIIQGDIVGDDSYVESRLIPKLQKAIDRGYKLRVDR